MINNINIPCNKLWFERIKEGGLDLRPVNAYWTKRLKGRTYDTITFTLGYPKRDDGARRYTIPFRGVLIQNEMYVILTTEEQHTKLGRYIIS